MFYLEKCKCKGKLAISFWLLAVRKKTAFWQKAPTKAVVIKANG
jgi:hypothetical protein